MKIVRREGALRCGNFLSQHIDNLVCVRDFPDPHTWKHLPYVLKLQDHSLVKVELCEGERHRASGFLVVENYLEG